MEKPALPGAGAATAKADGGVIIPTGSRLSITRLRDIHGAYTVAPPVYTDDRGFFQEVFNEDKYPRVVDSLGGQSRPPSMRQFSISSSRAGTVRGIHCAPYGKLVQCTAGRVFDVIVDLRVRSPTYGRWFGTWLSAQDHRQVYIPARCGHGFFAAVDNSVLTYCQEGTYVPGADVELNPLDADVGIVWPPPIARVATPAAKGAAEDTACGEKGRAPPPVADGYVISSKDRAAQSLRELRPRLEAISAVEGWCGGAGQWDGGGAVVGASGGATAAATAAAAAATSGVSATHIDDDNGAGDNKAAEVSMATANRDGGVDYLLLGASGFLGSRTLRELRRQGRSVATPAVRLEDFAGLCRALQRHGPVRCGVICCAGTAGRPNISWCDAHEPETIQLNVVGQLNVAEACRQQLSPDGQPTHCTLIGTGCIYTYDAAAGHPRDGGPSTAFTEKDQPNFHSNAYARLRVALEQLVAPFPNVLLLRVTYPVDCETMHPRSLAAKLLQYSRITAEPTSITVMDDLWPRLPRLVERRATGVLNFNSAGTTDNNRILQLWKRLVDPAHPAWTVDATVTVEGTRAYAHLSTARLQELDPDVPVLTAEAAIERGFQDFARHR